MSSRRHFILESTLLAAAAVVAPGLVARAVAPAPRMAPGELGLETFAGVMNQHFQASLPGARVIMLELIAAVPVPAAHGEQFVLVFRGPPGLLLGQDTYWFEQEKIGKFPMFIVPAASSSPGAASYVAVFNRLSRHAAARAGEGLRTT